MSPLLIAHRGDSARRPENTLASFASALETGVDVVELDVQLTADREVAVIHDGTVDRTTDGTGDVRSMTLPELRRLSAGYPQRFGSRFSGERVPTLAEVLAFLRGRSRVMIEIKGESVGDDAEDGVEARTVAEVRKAQMQGEAVLISFDRRALARCRSLAPEISRGVLFGRVLDLDEMVVAAREVASALVLPEKGLLSDDLAERTRRAGLLLATWVVDDAEELRQLSRFGLYGIATNRPAEMLEALSDLP